MNLQKEHLGFLMSDIFRLMRHNYQQQVQGASHLTFAQAKALRYISTFQGLRQVELAEKLDIKPITIARLVDLLSEAKMVERRPDINDRRAYCLYLLPEGERELIVVNRVISEIREKAFVGIDESQHEVVFQYLKTMRHNLSQ
ncbi:MAG: DNA-binding MarR family transcriptional regulator [Psychromonas sp.]|jgi:DNA-binding MarR family transcriptional regulator|uniref:MarR family winged helix-turn-helix transcriptional regulator n=1 Tax=Psychromonas sp. TaxID=1884585 RepID=UPI0039E46C6C